MDERDFLTKAEAMNFLRLSRATVDRFIKNRELAHFKVGKKVLFHRRDLERFIESKRVPHRRRAG